MAVGSVYCANESANKGVRCVAVLTSCIQVQIQWPSARQDDSSVHQGVYVGAAAGEQLLQVLHNHLHQHQQQWQQPPMYITPSAMGVCIAAVLLWCRSPQGIVGCRSASILLYYWDMSTLYHPLLQRLQRMHSLALLVATAEIEMKSGFGYSTHVKVAAELMVVMLSALGAPVVLS